jgi:hypothetical protein
MGGIFKFSNGVAEIGEVIRLKIKEREDELPEEAAGLQSVLLTVLYICKGKRRQKKINRKHKVDLSMLL